MCGVGQFLFDRPNRVLALLDIGFLRLGGDHLVDLGVAITGVVALRLAHVVLIKVPDRDRRRLSR
jgi:hypothetical protein